VLLVLAGEGLDDPHRLHRPLDDAEDLALPLAHLARRDGDPSVEPTDGEQEQRTYAQGQEGELPVEMEHDRGHPAQQDERGGGGEQAVHGQRLQREGVRGDPVEKVPGLGPAVEGHGEPMQVRVEVAAQVAHHPLPDADGGVVGEHGQAAEGGIDQDERDAGGQEQGPGAPAPAEAARRGLAAEDRVDDELDRPGLEQLERGRQAHLSQRPQDAPAVRPEVPGDPPGEAAHFTSTALASSGGA
jgi:hypothetical protein